MSNERQIDVLWDDNPVDITSEAIKKDVLGIFLKEIYDSLRGKKD